MKNAIITVKIIHTNDNEQQIWYHGQREKNNIHKVLDKDDKFTQKFMPSPTIGMVFEKPRKFKCCS